MQRCVRELVWVRRRVLSSILIVAVAFAALTVSWNPVAHAEGPPGDCCSEVLSTDPLHCYVLEEAQRDGVIEVEGIYEAEDVLYIFFNDLRGSGTPGPFHFLKIV